MLEDLFWVPRPQPVYLCCKRPLRRVLSAEFSDFEIEADVVLLAQMGGLDDANLDPLVEMGREEDDVAHAIAFVYVVSEEGDRELHSG